MSGSDIMGNKYVQSITTTGTAPAGEAVAWEYRYKEQHPQAVGFGNWGEWQRISKQKFDEIGTFIAKGYAYERRTLAPEQPGGDADNSYAAQIKRAKAELAAIPEERRRTLQLEGTDPYLSAGAAPSREAVADERELALVGLNNLATTMAGTVMVTPEGCHSFAKEILRCLDALRSQPEAVQAWAVVGPDGAFDFTALAATEDEAWETHLDATLYTKEGRKADGYAAIPVLITPAAEGSAK